MVIHYILYATYRIKMVALYYLPLLFSYRNVPCHLNIITYGTLSYLCVPEIIIIWL